MSLLPDGIEVLNPPIRVKDEIETFTVLDRTTNRLERVEFTWTPFAKVAYRRTGLLSWEPYRTFDYDALDLHRRELGVAAVRRLLNARA